MSCPCMILFPSLADSFPTLLRFNDLKTHRGLPWNNNVIFPPSESRDLFKLQLLHMNLFSVTKAGSGRAETCRANDSGGMILELQLRNPAEDSHLLQAVHTFFLLIRPKNPPCTQNPPSTHPLEDTEGAHTSPEAPNLSWR